MTYAVVGLGACGPEADAHLLAATKRIRAHSAWQPLASSSVYRNPAWGTPLPHDFRNSAMLLQTHYAPAAILRCLLGIERELGRVRGVRYGRRNIDLDLLWMNSEPIGSAFLQLPHPRLEERAFALVPMIEVLERGKIAVPYGFRRAASRLRGRERLFPHRPPISPAPLGDAEPR